MTDPTPPLRPARPADAARLAELVNYAGEGLPFHLWSELATDGMDAWEIGRQRALRDTGAFSWRNAVVIDAGGEAAACLIGYAIPEEVEPIPDDMPPMFRPLQELENLAPGSWYVNVMAVVPYQRGKGLGSRLLEAAHDMARDGGHGTMSIIVSDANTHAWRLYERFGFVKTASRPVVEGDWAGAGRTWILLTKTL